MVLSETTPCIEKEKLEKEKSNGLDELSPATIKSLGGSLTCDKVVGAFPHLFKETLNKHQGKIDVVKISSDFPAYSDTPVTVTVLTVLNSPFLYQN